MQERTFGIYIPFFGIYIQFFGIYIQSSGILMVVALICLLSMNFARISFPLINSGEDHESNQRVDFACRGDEGD